MSLAVLSETFFVFYLILKCFCIIAVFYLFVGCQSESTNRFIYAHDVGIDFNNLIDSDTLNVFDFHYLYNGGGVGIADFNADGIKDVVFGGNVVPSIIYLGTNEGKFNKCPISSGFNVHTWVNGIAIVDINFDGLSDIYLSVGGPNCEKDPCENLLYINTSQNNTISFKEQSKEYGLNIQGYSQQTQFFDADQDGDLDAYVLQNHIDPTTKNYPKPKRYFSSKSIDKFLINQQVETGQKGFIDQSELWGLTDPGFGLGIALTDVNHDGFIDVYVANDFISDDIFYLNENGKTFKNISKEVLKHSSYNSMGVDIADINNDNHDDILVLDMLPYSNARQKTMLGSMNYNKYILSLKENYLPQYIKNTLQLHSGIHQLDSSIYPFVDIANYAQMHQTDWSWAPLIADFDNDGDSDVFITNGYGKNITDLDFVNYGSNNNDFKSKEKVKEKIAKKMDDLDAVKLPNHYFEQVNNLTFKESNGEFFTPSISNGAVYVDYDDDGDLDIITNNINEKASLLENTTKGSNFLKIKLKGQAYNLDAIGARVSLVLDNDKIISKLNSPIRSYLSSVDSDLHFGLGQNKVKRIEVQWPNNKYSIIDSVSINHQLTLDYYKLEKKKQEGKPFSTPLFSMVDTINRRNFEPSAKDFDTQNFLMKKIKGSKHLTKKSELNNHFINLNNGVLSYSPKGLNNKTKLDIKGVKIVDFCLADMDKNGTDDVVFSGIQNNENDSKEGAVFGIFLFENEYTLVQTWIGQHGYNYLALLDVNQDGSVDILASNTPDAASYPTSSQLQIFIANNGEYLDQTSTYIDHQDLGHVQDITTADMDMDGDQDVLLVGEWMSPKILINTGQKLDIVNHKALDSLLGMWQSISTLDIDDDGDQDILLGNLGLNTRHQASEDKPLKLLLNDLDNNGHLDPILSFYSDFDQQYYTYQSKDDIAKSVPGIKQHFVNYKDFADAHLEQIISAFDQNPEYKRVITLEHVMIENLGSKGFAVKAFPKELQRSIINGFYTYDFNGDGKLDIATLANNQNVEIHNGNMDGSNGEILLNMSNFEFEMLSTSSSSFNFPSATFDMIELSKGEFLVNSSEGDFLLTKSVNKE